MNNPRTIRRHTIGTVRVARGLASNDLPLGEARLTYQLLRYDDRFLVT